jgi:23S rRNA (adenine2030-N6)-methyltransferase
VELGRLFEHDRQTRVQLMDGYQGLKAFLPPKERRGLVFIDSSFDRSQEFERLIEGLAEGTRRFANGVYALWYPLMDPTAMRAFERDVVATGIRRILQLEVSVMPQGWTGSSRGCGMLVVNPPFGFEDIARPMLDWVAPILARDPTVRPRIHWLAGE